MEVQTEMKKIVILEKEWYDIKQDGTISWRTNIHNLIGRYKPPEESDLLVNEPESNPGDDDFSAVVVKTTQNRHFYITNFTIANEEGTSPGCPTNSPA